jgi:hypothetical protein
MAHAKADVVAGERKAVTRFRSQTEDATAASFEALIRQPVKTVVGEQRSEDVRRFRLRELSAVHAGGEQGWSADHLEPFFVPHDAGPLRIRHLLRPGDSIFRPLCPQSPVLAGWAWLAI